MVEEVEDNLVTTDEVVDNSNREEIEGMNTVERQEGRHEEDFGEHLEFEYQEFPPFIGDYAISDEFP